MRLIFLALTLLVTISVRASEVSDRFTHEWRTSCKSETRSLQVVFKSVSGDSTNDDMSVFVQVGKEPSLRVPIKPALFAPGTLKSNVSSVCEKTTGVTMGSGHVLLLVQKDNRPSEDRISAILIDANSGKTLDVAPDIGALSLDSEFRQKADTIRVRLVRSWNGASSSREPDPVMAWCVISESDGKLRLRWEKK